MNCEALACRLSLVLLTLAAVPAAAEPAPLPISFDHVSFADGLANSSVSMITQDDRGFLWFGTQAGLQRYDGYGMDLFTAEPFDRNSLSNQLVQTMYLGPDNDMWIGTYGGLNKLDIDTEQVTRFPHGDAAPYALSNSVVTSIDHDAEGNLWVATLDGLNRLDSEEDKRFTVFPADPEDQTRLPDDTVRAVFTDSRGDLWVGTHGGLSRLVSTGNDRSVSFETWGVVETDQAGQRDHGLVSPYVMAITEDGSGNLWIGSWDGGLSRFDATTEQFKHYDLPDNRVYAVMVTTEGLVYSATWGGGLYILDPETGAINEYRHDPDVSGSLAHDVVYSLFQDKSGIVWIGTNGNGISKFDGSRVDFQFLHQELPREQRLDTGKIQTLWRDPATNDLYVGLQNNGLNVVDGETGRVTRYRHDPNDPQSLSSDTVNGIHQESTGTLLILTHNGINRFFPPSQGEDRGTFSLLREPDIPDPINYDIVQDQAGRLWIGSYSSGVFRYDQDGSLHQYSHRQDTPRSLSDNLVYEIAETRDGTIWVATNSGLNRYVPETDDFDRFVYDPDAPDGISGLSVGNIYQDAAGELWIGTRSGGLNLFDRETETFERFTVQDGLTSNTVVGIIEGVPGELFVATPNGLNLVRDGGAEVVQIDERDGLHTREFSTGNARSEADTVLIGAFSEVVRVAPRMQVEEGIPPKTVITEVSVMQDPLDGPYKYSRDLHTLTLSHEENFITFMFSALDFSLPARNTYRYRLHGFDADWIDAGTRREAMYTNLPPGKYLFEVVGANARGLQSSEPARFEVIITPPFWRTTGFMVIAAVLVLGMVVGVYLARVRRLYRVNRMLEDTVAERTARLTEANEVKDRFFSIIAHDLRGPVSGMESLTRHAVTEHTTYRPEETAETFSTLHSTSSALLGMLENLLEWARVQTGGISFEAQPVPIASLVDEAYVANSGSAHSKGISLQVEVPPALHAFADVNMMRVVLQNLVNNAIKFTPSGGSVTLTATVCESGRQVQLSVRDTGVGIPAEKIPGLFQLDNRYRTAGTAGERGSGFGLSLCKDLIERQGGAIAVSSEKGVGTTITVTLPTVDEHADRNDPANDASGDESSSL